MDGDRLTEDEAAAVFRRAAELEVVDGEGTGAALDVAALEDIGRQAGLSPLAVRQAVAELRAGTLPVAPPPGPPARQLVGPPLVVCERPVPGPAAAVEAEVQRYCRQQLFELRRRMGARTLWAPRCGLVAELRRAFDLGKRLRLDNVGRLTVTAVELPDDRVRVRLEADLDAFRRGLALGLVGAPAGLGVAGTAVALALAGLDPVALAAVAGGAGLTGGGWATARAVFRSARLSTAEALDGFLDSLEHRPRPLARRRTPVQR